MEPKDYWAQLAPGIAMLISLVALGISWASYNLARARDRRELEREQPAVSIDMPICAGVGPWTVSYTVRNRTEEPIVLVGIRMPLNIGRTAITYRHPIRFAQIDAVEHHYTKSMSDEAGDYEVLILRTALAPGESVHGDFDVIPEPRAALRRPTPVTFYVDAMVRDRAQTVYRLRSDRVASASVNATKP